MTVTKATPPKASKPVLTLGADLSPAVKAIEEAYRLIQAEYPDAPNVTIVVKRDERAWGHTTVAKVWAPSKAKSKSATQFEIMISGENIARGAEAVLGTLLHEAAHARNLNNGVLDTDTNGRHSTKFKTVAEDHGLSVEQAGWHGWTKTELTDEGRKRWRKALGIIERGLAKSAATAELDVSHLAGATTKGGKPVLPPKGKGKGAGPVAPPKRGNRNLPKATCSCGHSIRASHGVLDVAKPTCSVCGDPFVVEAGE